MILKRLIRWLPFLVGLALLIGTAASLRSFHAQPPAVGLPIPEAPAGAAAITCLGYVDVEGGTTSLSPARPGCVTAIRVHEGDEVAAGSVLLCLDDRPARFAVGQARAAWQASCIRLAQARQTARQHPVRLAQQRSMLDAARFRLSAARHGQERKAEMLRSQLLSAPELAAAADQVSELEALCRVEQERLAELQALDVELPVRSAQAEVEASQAHLQEAEYALEQCQLKAPEAGIILRILAGCGTMLNGGAGPPAMLFRPARPLVIRAEIEQEFLGRVTVGQAARVEDEFHTGGPLHGRVLRLADCYTPYRTLPQQPPLFTDVPTAECLIALDAGCPHLRLGQRVRVTIDAP